MSVTETLLDVVRYAGYIASVTDDWIVFKVEGTPYRFETFENDNTYARLMVGFAIPGGTALDRLLATANEQNRKAKAVKTVVYPSDDDGHVSFSIELLFGDAAAWIPVIDRALKALRTVSDEYYVSLSAADAA